MTVDSTLLKLEYEICTRITKLSAYASEAEWFESTRGRDLARVPKWVEGVAV